MPRGPSEQAEAWRSTRIISEQCQIEQRMSNSTTGDERAASCINQLVHIQVTVTHPWMGTSLLMQLVAYSSPVRCCTCSRSPAGSPTTCSPLPATPMPLITSAHETMAHSHIATKWPKWLPHSKGQSVAEQGLRLSLHCSFSTPFA